MARVGHSLRERLDKSQAVIRLPQQQHARIRSQPLVFPPNLDGTIESGLEQPLLCFTHDVNPFSGSGATLRCRFLREKLSIRSLRSNGVLNNVGVKEKRIPRVTDFGSARMNLVAVFTASSSAFHSERSCHAR